MRNSAFKFYSILKNEDANPYIGDDILVVADGLGGSGSAVHAIDRAEHMDMRRDISAGAFGDIHDMSTELTQYIEELIAPMADDMDDTSALWASRIVIARCVYALTEGKFKNADLSDEKARAELAEFIESGLRNASEKFNLQKGKYDGLLLLPTTLAFMRFTETKSSVNVETVWAGDSRCYVLTADGLKMLSVDDEDSSGLITNLFYAGNDKVTLNYIRREIPKPCALLAVSDGIFDPFDPHENLGVEHTLLEAIRENRTSQEVAASLQNFYGSIHGDDATMAFVPIGFDSFEDMQKKLEKRTNEILEVRKKQLEMQDALEVLNRSEEEACHYVLCRTGDKYDSVISLLLDAMESGKTDIALIPEVIRVAETIKEECRLADKKIIEHNKEQALAELNSSVIGNPACVNRIFAPYKKIDIKTNHNIDRAFLELWQNATIYNGSVKSGEFIAKENELNRAKELFHKKIYEKIVGYRKCFDDLWGVQSLKKMREKTEKYLRIWDEIDLALQNDWKGIGDISALPQEDIPLAVEIRNHLEECRELKNQKEKRKSKLEYSRLKFDKAWGTVYKYLKSYPEAIDVCLTPETAQQISGKNFVAEPVTSSRNKILSALKARKEAIIPCIVKALADNCERASLIDGLYNVTKLGLFRTYFQLKACDMGEAKALENKLSELEKEYSFSD